MAFAAVAALFTATEVTAALVLSAVAEVGMVTTVVGAVTGNKDLLKIGGIMGIVGGVGGLVNGLGQSAVSAAVDQTAAETARLGAQEAAASAVAPVGDAVTAGLGDSVASNAGSALGPSTMGPPSDLANNAFQSGYTGAPPSPTGTGNVPMGQTAAQPVSGAPGAGPADVSNPYSNAAPSPSAGANAPVTPADSSGTFRASVDSQSYNNMLPNGGLEPVKSSSFWGNLNDFLKKNNDLVNVGSSVFQGVAKQQNADREFGLKNDQFNYTKQQNANSGNWAPIGYKKPTGILGQAK